MHVPFVDGPGEIIVLWVERWQREERHIDTAVAKVGHVELFGVQGEQNVVVVGRGHAAMLDLVHDHAVGVERVKIEHDEPAEDLVVSDRRCEHAKRRAGHQLDVLQKVVGIVRIAEIPADDVQIGEFARRLHAHELLEPKRTGGVVVDVDQLTELIPANERDECW